jgi:hypothetical protein
VTEKTNTSIGSSSSLSSESETSEMTENSDCGQEPGEVDINKANKSKMKPVFATKPVCTYNMSRLMYVINIAVKKHICQ